jgi:hypothetical protein
MTGIKCPGCKETDNWVEYGQATIWRHYVYNEKTGKVEEVNNEIIDWTPYDYECQICKTEWRRPEVDDI